MYNNHQLFTASRIQVRASKEVISSAGVVGTPTILLNSGIGDRNDLQAVGIEPLLHLPSVGKNASDQPGLFVQWKVNSNDTRDNLRINQTLFNEAFKLWNETGGGPLGELGTTHVAWLRLPQNASILKTFNDPSAGRETPQIELMLSVTICLILKTC
ncbi:MAG TPA: GMC family oxidoreductase N-terminal domain-containing protein [Chlamydiales bacterium]|nr:GMC family oxidoreductase N-terminal domain-containing protein [Chlamydiales bacterium]